MRLFLFIFLPFYLLFGAEKNISQSTLVNCYEIFEQRRGELEYKLNQIEEQRQAFQALKDASMNILKKKEEKIDKKLKEVNATLQTIEQRKKEIEELVKKNESILKAIKDTSSSKLVQSYSKMRAGNAAQILANMDINTSLEILSKLSPKVLSKIFSKMDPSKAGLLTEKLKNYIPKGKK